MKRLTFRLLVCLGPAALLLLHTAAWKADTDLRQLVVSRRFWESFAVASSQYQEDRHPSRFEPVSLDSWPASSYRMDLQDYVTRQAERQGIGFWQPWRVLRREPPFKRNPIFHRGTEDVGRAVLARIGFHLLRGVSPFLILWIGPLLAVPLLAWAGAELLRADRPIAAVVFGALAACSPFLVLGLAFHYTSAALYPLAMVPVLALAVFVALGPSPSPAALLTRSLVFGVSWAVLTLCRGGIGLVAPVAAALILYGAWRVAGPPSRRRTAAALALVLMATPWLLIRPRQHHHVWFPIWQGLGDFDRQKGYAFSDGTLLEALQRAGATDIPDNRNVTEMDKDYSREVAFTREQVLHDVAHDPAWYAGILARRVVATVGLTKLWPRASVDGRSFRESGTENEGAMDVYWGFVPTADQVGVGPWRWELPLPLLWLPLVAWLAVTLRARGGRAPEVIAVVGVAAAALSVPVLITVGGAFEPQAFVVVYWLCAALLADAAVRRLRPRPG